MTWLFNNTGGSVLLVSLMHQTTNVVTDLLGPFAVPADQTISLWLGAAVHLAVVTLLVLVYGPVRLSREPADALPAALPDATGLGRPRSAGSVRPSRRSAGLAGAPN